MTNHLIRYFDMFAGIGGFRTGLTRAGSFQCVAHCEIDKYAEAVGRRFQAAEVQLRKGDSVA